MSAALLHEPQETGRDRSIAEKERRNSDVLALQSLWRTVLEGAFRADPATIPDARLALSPRQDSDC
jgi:hypothetical protein